MIDLILTCRRKEPDSPIQTRPFEFQADCNFRQAAFSSNDLFPFLKLEFRRRFLRHFRWHLTRSLSKVKSELGDLGPT